MAESLYDLTAEYRQLLEMAQDGDDQDFINALNETLDVQGEMIDSKIEATIMVARRIEADAEYCMAESKRLAERAKAFERNAQACYDRVLNSMESTNKTKIKRQLFTITRTAGKPVCQVNNEKLIPPEYIKVKETRSPDKTAILHMLKGGALIPGCELATGKESLRIK